jgi:ditrans,polycis-polyprenyl diphosphate synthase
VEEHQNKERLNLCTLHLCRPGGCRSKERGRKGARMVSITFKSFIAALEALFFLLMSPLLPIIQRILLSLLSLGPIPQHIGLIMDGNRRFAQTFPTGPIPVSQGHLSGFNTLRSVLEACLHLKGLNTVTVYAFAIDNFARNEEEVHSLMELAKRNLVQLAAHGEVLARHSVRLRMIGRRELLPQDVRLAVEKAERMTQRNTR